MRNILHIVVLLGAALACGGTVAGSSGKDPLQGLLSMPEPPPGVVFEVGTDDEDALTVLVPKIRKYAERLRKRFPDLEIAVVTHGVELFSLMEAQRGHYPTLHQAVQSLAENDEIPVHVCGAHASWKDRAPEDFPEYVDIAASGPAQVNDYASLGFVVVRLD